MIIFLILTHIVLFVISAVGWSRSLGYAVNCTEQKCDEFLVLFWGVTGMVCTCAMYVIAHYVIKNYFVYHSDLIDSFASHVQIIWYMRFVFTLIFVEVIFSFYTLLFKHKRSFGLSFPYSIALLIKTIPACAVGVALTFMTT